MSTSEAKERETQQGNPDENPDPGRRPEAKPSEALERILFRKQSTGNYSREVMAEPLTANAPLAE